MALGHFKMGFFESPTRKGHFESDNSKVLLESAEQNGHFARVDSKRDISKVLLEMGLFERDISQGFFERID